MLAALVRRSRSPLRAYAALLSVAVALPLLATQGHAQQPAAAVTPAPCIGYAYNVYPTPLLPSGIQVVAQVLPDTPAEAGGLQAGDLLVSVAGVPVGSPAPAPTLTPGDTIPFILSRDGRTVTLQVVVGQRLPDPAGEPVCRPFERPDPDPTR